MANHKTSSISHFAKVSYITQRRKINSAVPTGSKLRRRKLNVVDISTSPYFIHANDEFFREVFAFVACGRDPIVNST